MYAQVSVCIKVSVVGGLLTMAAVCYNYLGPEPPPAPKKTTAPSHLSCLSPENDFA